MISANEVKPLLVMGEFSDFGKVIRNAYSQGKKIFKTNDNIIVVHPPINTPFGWVVLVARPPVGEGKASGSLEVDSGDK